MVVTRKSGDYETIPFGWYEGNAFEKFIGDPLAPPFLIRRDALTVVVFDVILPGYKWHPRTYKYISLVGRHSIIGGTSLYHVERVSTSTGKVVWRRELKGLLKVEPKADGITIHISSPPKKLVLAWSDGQTLKRLPTN